MPTRLGKDQGREWEGIKYQVNNVDVEYPEANRYRGKRSSSTVKVSGRVLGIERQSTVNDTEEQHLDV
jgi:hypothetical protein